MKCAICEEEIKGKGKKLATGERICKDCYKENLDIAECEICGSIHWAKEMVKVEYEIRCAKCHEKAVVEMLEELKTYQNYVKDHLEMGDTLEDLLTEEEYFESLKEQMADMCSRAERRTAERLINEGWGKTAAQGGHP